MFHVIYLYDFHSHHSTKNLALILPAVTIPSNPKTFIFFILLFDWAYLLSILSGKTMNFSPDHCFPTYKAGSAACPAYPETQQASIWASLPAILPCGWSERIQLLSKTQLSLKTEEDSQYYIFSSAFPPLLQSVSPFHSQIQRSILPNVTQAEG